MRNKDIVEHLRAIAYRYRTSADKNNKMRAIAFSKAADIIEKQVVLVANMGEADLLALPSVGKGIVKEILEFVLAGKTKRGDTLNEDAPPLSLKELEQLSGVGSRTALDLWQTYGISSIAELREAVENLGLKEQKWTDRLKEFDMRSDRLPRYVVMPFVEATLAQLKKLPFVLKAKAAGSIRRFKETTGDIDILISCEYEDNAQLVKWLAAHFEIVRGGYEEKQGQPVLRYKVTANTYFDGKTKQIDFNICHPLEWGCHLAYLTGSKEFNIALRALAIQQSYRLNEHRITDKQENVYFQKESDLFTFLEIPFVPPECRDAFALAQVLTNPFDSLLRVADIAGDYHTHTIFSDGKQTPEQLVESAKASNFKWLGIADHDDSMPAVKGLSLERIPEYLTEIQRVRQVTQFPLLAGIELDVDNFGLLRYDINTLAKFDFIILATHKNPLNNVTTRLCKALEFVKGLPVVILAHPTNRHIQQGHACEIDWDKILEIRPNIIVEINAQPDRLDLPADLIRMLRGRVKFTIASDKHSADTFIDVALAVKEARKAGLTKDDIFDPLKLQDDLQF